MDSMYTAPLDRAHRAAVAFLAGHAEASVSASATRAQLLGRLDHPLRDEGVPADRVIDDLVAGVDGGLIRSGGGRFFAWVIGGAVPAALAADWLTSAWDQNSGMYAAAPASAIVEEVAGAWLKELLGLPASAAFALVTGCQMAHFTCLAAARNHLLAARDWDVERRGLCGAPAIRILTNDQYHSTLARAVRHLGLGTDALVPVAADGQGCMRPDALDRALREAAGRPTIVHLQAGDINTGAYEDFTTLIPIAHRHDAWVHVDGAFGLWAAVSPRRRALLRGVDAADSWATDGHKWLNVPYDCGYAFVAHPGPLRASMSLRGSYVPEDAGPGRDQMDWTPEWSRRGRGFATYAAIRQLGRRGIADLVDRCCDHAHVLTTRIGALSGAELLCEPIINQGLVRFLDPVPSATAADHDRWTDDVTAAVTASGEAFFSGSTWRGMRCMRVSVSSWMTTARDVDRAVEAVRRVLAAPPVRAT
jgi:glutamate/tyrosine decarboxylase-like PLP-dependent enzyme